MTQGYEWTDRYECTRGKYSVDPVLHFKDSAIGIKHAQYARPIVHGPVGPVVRCLEDATEKLRRMNADVVVTPGGLARIEPAHREFRKVVELAKRAASADD